MKCRAFWGREARFGERPEYGCKKGNMFDLTSSGVGGGKYWIENGGKVYRVEGRVKRRENDSVRSRELVGFFKQ